MKYCLTDTVSASYLKKADEIMVFGHFNLMSRLLNIVENYPDCEHILVPTGNFSIQEIKNIMALTHDKTIFYSPDFPSELVPDDLPWFSLTPVHTIMELAMVAECYHPCYIYIGDELMHDLDAVAAYGIPIRFSEAVMKDRHFNLDSLSLLLGFIRPEDTEFYSKYISVIEFVGDEKREEGLFRIFKEDGKWPGKLKTIYPRIKSDACNRLIPPEFAERRANCELKCLRGGRCRYCYNILEYFAKEENIRKAKELKDGPKKV